MKALITGATGFIGSHLAECLAHRGDIVRCIVRDARKASSLVSLGVEVVEADFASVDSLSSSLRDIENIFHVAGVTRASTYKEYYDGNFGMTHRLIEACRKAKPALNRFVYVSSLAAVGPSRDGDPVNEETPYHPVSHYGKSKMMGELAVWKAREWLPVTVVRPSAVYGPRERDMADYIRCVRRGLIPLIGTRPKYLNLVHCEDVVSGILLAAECAQAAGRAYFLGSEENYTTKRIGEAIAEAAQRQAHCVKIPHAFVTVIAVAAECLGRVFRRPVFFNLEKAKESFQSWACSVERAKGELGYRQRITLEEGMRRACIDQSEEERHVRRSPMPWSLRAAEA